VRRDIFLNGLHGFIGNFINAFKSELSSFDYNRISAVRNLAEKYDGNTDEFIEAIGDWLKTQDQSIKKTVQFMTIHKSKGLEFDIVFIPDTAGPPQASPLPEIARAGEISDGTRWINYLPVKNICCQIPDLEFHTQQLAQENAFAQCCKYYVALTRAKRAMYIFVELPKTSSTFRFEMEMAKQLERFVPEDHYKISFSAMKTRCYFRDQVDLVYASGSENWYESIDTEKVQPDAAPECSDVKFIYPSKGRRLASHQDSGFIQIPPEVRFAEHSAADLGTELHNLFERINFIDDSFDADGFLAGQEYAETISVEAKELFRIAVAPGSSIRSALAEPSGKYILWKERRFLIKDDDGATVPGAFDRVIIYLDEAENPVRAAILDYKSDKVESLSELISRHRKQLELYRKCLGKMTGIPESEIQISLAALRSGEIAEII
jgi:ATP-dependent exoDNAse (exonuclease V) beta subunit